MTKQAVIAIVVGVLILLGAAGAFLYSQSKSSNAKKAIVATKVSPSPASNDNMQNSITEIFAGGKTSKCTFDVASEKGSTMGTIYTTEDMARADFTTEVNGKEETTHMIKVGDTFYMWGDSLPMGIKMVMSVNDMSSKLKDNSDFASIDPSKKIDFKCATWTKDATLFNPPTSVKFTSFGNMMPTESSVKSSGTPKPTSSTTSNSTNSNECNICNSLTGAAKSACVAQFNCQ